MIWMLQGLRLNCWLPLAIMLVLSIGVAAWQWTICNEDAASQLSQVRAQLIAASVSVATPEQLGQIWAHRSDDLRGIAWLDVATDGERVVIRQQFGSVQLDTVEPPYQMFAGMHEMTWWQTPSELWTATPLFDDQHISRGTIISVWYVADVHPFPWQAFLVEPYWVTTELVPRAADLSPCACRY